MDGEVDHSVFMPFINVKSVGGKFDDEAFSCGYEMGVLDFKLFQASVVQAQHLYVTIRVDNQTQADLIAMKHRYMIVQRIPDVTGSLVNCLFVKCADNFDVSIEG